MLISNLMKKEMQLKKHIRNMEWELEARLNPEYRYGYMKGINYFRKQIEVAKQKLKSFQS
jgi:hypothetical protein